jgi:hypothetical protein
MVLSTTPMPSSATWASPRAHSSASHRIMMNYCLVGKEIWKEGVRVSRAVLWVLGLAPVTEDSRICYASIKVRLLLEFSWTMRMCSITCKIYESQS